MAGQNKAMTVAYWSATLATLVAALGMLALYTPEEASMGPIQRVFYLHMPMAINTMLACMVVFAASIGYLLQRRNWWDDLAAAAAKVAVLLCTGVLITGMIWGKSAWGQWWTWSPRLTFSLMLWLLYVVYLVVRNSIESPQRRAVVSAVYGISAFIDVPLVWLSARLIPDIHPSGIALSGEMKLTLAIWFVPVTLLAAGLIMTRYQLYRFQRKNEEVEEEGFEVVGVSASGGVA
jgi:heme exporter protein C